MTKSSSCRGDGLGDNLCLPLELGKGDLKAFEEVVANGEGECCANPDNVIVPPEPPDDEEDEEECDDLLNHVPGLFIALIFGLTGRLSIVVSRCMIACIVDDFESVVWNNEMAID